MILFLFHFFRGLRGQVKNSIGSFWIKFITNKFQLKIEKKKSYLKILRSVKLLITDKYGRRPKTEEKKMVQNVSEKIRLSGRKIDRKMGRMRGKKKSGDRVVKI